MKHLDCLTQDDAPENSKTADPLICRICYETDRKHLISPCKCQGSLGYSHEYCLKAWISEKFPDPSEAFCEICKEHYKIEQHFSRSFRKIENENKKYCFYCKFWTVMFFLLLSGVVTMLVFLFYVNFEEKPGYSISVVCCCLISVLFHLCLLIKVIISSFYVKSIISWSILSLEKF